MKPGTWEYAIEQLAAAVQETTADQVELAAQIGLTIPPNNPGIVAAALLRVALFEELHLPAESPVSDHFRSRLKSLRTETKLKVSPKNDEEAAALVKFLRLLRRKRCLTKHRPTAGDVVSLPDGEKAEVSSIGPDGRVYFKGGRGYRAWPDMIESVVARNGASTSAAKKARIEAENAAAVRASSPEWSATRSEDLEEFAVWDAASEEDIDELEEVINRADDEKPVQKFLQDRAYLLTALLGGKERFCIPQKRLGGEFIPDFVIADVDSLGVRWLLVELETPKSGIYLKDGSALDKFAREGVDQIIDWRSWMMNNIAYAQRPRKNHGLGLPDQQPSGRACTRRPACQATTNDGCEAARVAAFEQPPRP